MRVHMKALAAFLAVVGTTQLLLATELDPAKRYTLICDYIEIDLDPRLVSMGYEPVPDLEQRKKLSTATVVVSNETENENGVAQHKQIASKRLDNGRAVIEGETDESMFVKISIVSGEESLLSTRSVIAPRDVLSVAVVDYPEPMQRDRLALVGHSNLVNDPEKKFTVIGNLSSVDRDLTATTASVVSYGGGRVVEFGTVLLDDGTFLIEGEIDEPTVVNIEIGTGEVGYGAFSHAIVEPQSVISVVPDGLVQHQLFATSGTGRHLQLIESWLHNKDYRALVDKYTLAVRELRAESVARRQLLVQNPEAQLESIYETDVYKKQEQLWERLLSYRQDAVNSMARNAQDPLDRLLALQMSTIRASDALPIYDELALLLDDDSVARKVKPARDELFRRLQAAANGQSLVEGSLAPKFKLPNLQGQEIELSDALGENELILIEFWASWCAPCIAKFPYLSELYEDYSTNGFEIVTVSIDYTFEDWKNASIEQDIPWLNVADIGGFSQSVPTSFGIFFVPMNYLLDTSGSIVQKNIEPDQLQKLLANRFRAKSQSAVHPER